MGLHESGGGAGGGGRGAGYPAGGRRSRGSEATAYFFGMMFHSTR